MLIKDSPNTKKIGAKIGATEIITTPNIPIIGPIIMPGPSSEGILPQLRLQISSAINKSNCLKRCADKKI